MRRKSLTVTLGGALATALLAISLGLLATSPVSAQAGVTLTINPTQGPVGTTISFTATGCPAVADGPDGRVFLLYGNFSSGFGVNPGANFEGSPGTGSFTVTAPPADVSNEVEVLVDCFATPGHTDEEQAADKLFTITGATTTTTSPGATTTTTSPGGTTTTTSPGATTTTTAAGGTGTPSRAAQPVRRVPSFTG